MKLTYSRREEKNKAACKQLRRAGKIPAVLYSKGQAGEKITIDLAEYEAALRQIKQGHLSVTKFELTMEDGSTRQALIKDVQYDVTSYRVLHIDFEELHEDHKVTVRVPIEMTGVASCRGVKLGGFLRRIVRGIKVECLPKDIPSEFAVDVSDIGLKQSRKLEVIDFPAGVRPRARLEEVCVLVAKK